MTSSSKSPLADVRRLIEKLFGAATAHSPDGDRSSVGARLQAHETEHERLQRELELSEAMIRRERSEALEVHARLRIAQQRLAEIESSTIWRASRGLRMFLSRHPRLRIMLRRTFKLAYWTLTLQLSERSRSFRQGRDLAAAAAAGPNDTCVRLVDAQAQGWLGGQAFVTGQVYAPGAVALADADDVASRYAQATAAIASRYESAGRAHHLASLRAIAPGDVITGIFRKARPAADVARNGAKPHYTIVTVVGGKARFFPSCARSVLSLIEQTEAGRIGWIVVGDDPSLGADALAAMLPKGLGASVRILHDGAHRGVVARLNEARAAAAGDWLLFLHADDEIEPHAIQALDRAVARFSQCRYVSSCATDIDEAGEVLRWRPCSDPTLLFDDDDAIAPLIAVRRDLFDDIGSFRAEHAGAHHTDFALRAALHEPLLRVPDYLYRVRRRDDAASTEGARLRQVATANVLRDFLRMLAERHFPQPQQIKPAPRPPLKSGLCLIRTQGKRLELLSEAVASVAAQTVPVMPCVVVHGSEDTAGLVRSHLSGRALNAVVIAAPDLERRRGYPLNVGLDWLRSHASDYDFALFLDDDDILYPYFAARLTELADLTGCDVAVADTNRRIPWQATEKGHNLKPASALLAGNFMPIHSFIMRTALLTKDGLRFDEEIDYLEDWDFLVSLFAGGARFRFLPEALCEFRIIGDGSTPEKNRPIHFEFCRQQIQAKAAAVAQRMGPGRFLLDLASFDFSEQPELTPYETNYLRAARALFFASGGEAGK